MALLPMTSVLLALVKGWAVKARSTSLPPVQHVAPPPAVPEPPKTHQEAHPTLSHMATIQSFGFQKRVRSVPPEGSDVRIVDFSQALQKELHARGIPFFAHCYLRGKAAQEAALAAGVTKAKWGQSPHNHGMAVDLVHFGRFWNLDPREWALIGAIGKEVARRRGIKVTWGGDWKFYDPAHWELTDWKTIRDKERFIPFPDPIWKDKVAAQDREDRRK